MTIASDEAVLTADATSSPCVACRLPLPIRPRPAEDVGQTWLCTRCGTKHHGLFLANAPREIVRNVRPADPKQAMPAVVAQTEHAPQGSAKTALSSRSKMRSTQESVASRAIDSAAASAA